MFRTLRGEAREGWGRNGEGEKNMIEWAAVPHDLYARRSWVCRFTFWGEGEVECM